MATMYSLFFGILLTAVCGIVVAGDGAVGAHGAIGEFTIYRHPGLDPGSLTDQQKRVNLAGFPMEGRCYVEGQGGKGQMPKQVRHDGANIRRNILQIATREIGTREATGRNDGKCVEEYLRYTHLDKGHEWCASFVSWCYGQAGLPQPRNPWSPALFPKARTYCKGGPACLPSTADIFGIYGRAAKRINHVGLVKGVQGQYLITVEGNSNDRVESRRRHLYTIYALSDWVTR